MINFIQVVRGNGICAFLVIGVLAMGVATANAQSRSAPFKLQRNGSLSIKDIVKLTRQSPGRDRITDDELEKIKLESPTPYGKEFRETEGKIMPPRADIYKSSELLGSNGVHTLLPRKSVLFVPDHLKDKVLKERKGELVLWPQFLKENYLWLQTREVSLAIAKGEEPFSEAIQEIIPRSRKVIVAVYKRSPISVHTPKEEVESDLSSEIQAKTETETQTKK